MRLVSSAGRVTLSDRPPPSHEPFSREPPGPPRLMKRTLAAVTLLFALCALFKLTVKERSLNGPEAHAPEIVATTEADPQAAMLERYPDQGDLIKRVYGEYRQNAIAIDQTDGLRGLTLLDKLGVEAIFLYERHPNDFRRLRDSLSDAAAADLLLHWREYFSLKHGDEVDRRVLIGEVARLTPAQRRLAAKYPNILPLLLTEPEGVLALVDHWTGEPKDLTDALALLGYISLEPGAADLRAALRTLDTHGSLALEAFRVQGLDGFATASLYAPVLQELGRALPLDRSLILLRVNSDYVDELLRTHRPEAVAGHLRHVAAARLVEAVGGSPNALRLVVEHGDLGERALTLAGPDAADVVYEDFSDGALRNQAVAALADHGKMALAMLDKYAADADFREILLQHGGSIIPPIAAVDANPESLALLRSKSNLSWKEWLAKAVLSASGDNGQATIAMIKKDGLDRVRELNSPEVEFYQFLPLYDLVHLGAVMSRGHAPTSGEMTWALIDGCFVVADALSLAALQPEGAAAAEAARAEMKTTAKGAVRVAGGEAVEEAAAVAGRALTKRSAEATSLHLSKWWAVRASGGTYQVLRRIPDALGRLTVPEIANLGRALCAKAGYRLSTFAPVRFFKDGLEIVKAIPPSKGLKYLGVQLTQAGVGIVGFQKMEEHLKSRRPQTSPQ